MNDVWSRIESAPMDGTLIVVGSGLFSTDAKWDGSGWFSKSVGRYIKATHWRKIMKWEGYSSKAQSTPSKQEKM